MRKDAKRLSVASWGVMMLAVALSPEAASASTAACVAAYEKDHTGETDADAQHSDATCASAVSATDAIETAVKNLKFYDDDEDHYLTICVKTPDPTQCVAVTTTAAYHYLSSGICTGLHQRGWDVSGDPDGNVGQKRLAAVAAFSSSRVAFALKQYCQDNGFDGNVSSQDEWP